MALKEWREEPNSGWRLGTLLRRTELWLIVVVVLITVGLFWLVGEQFSHLLAQADIVRHTIADFGSLAPLVYILLFALQILIAPLPGQFMGIMSGYFFGPFWGSLYSIIGLAIGAGLTIFLARRFGRPLLERFFAADQIRHWERRLRMRSPVTWGLLFVFPVPDLVFYVAGLSRVPLGQLLLAVICGRSLGLIFANLVGFLTSALPPEWVFAKWVVLGIGAFFLYRYQRNIRLGVLLTVRRLRRLVRVWQRQLHSSVSS